MATITNGNATSGKNTGQIGANTRPVHGNDVKGAVPQRHRIRLGEGNGTSDPYGTGDASRIPSTKGTNNPTGY